MKFQPMWQVIRRLSLGVSLIVMASTVLLLSDIPRAKQEHAPSAADKSKNKKPVKVAMFQMASQPILDEGATGVIDSLKAAGYDGDLLKLSRFNAEGELATANAIAHELAGGGYDLVITLTTGALQVMANANKHGEVRHVFGLVSDPVVAGVGIGTEPLDHPAHLVGVSTLPPIDKALRMARTLNPNLRKIGMAWNPAEINSEICTKLARKTCEELDIQLVEANVENAVAVKSSLAALLTQNLDALVVGGDVTALGALDLLLSGAKDNNIPLFTCMPGNAKRGALFDLGANYYEVGRSVGRLAVRVLDGESIAKLPLEVDEPPKLFLNKKALEGLSGGWSFPPEVLQQANAIIDETGEHDRSQRSAADSTTAPKRRWEVRILSYVNSLDAEHAEHGLIEGLKQTGLVEDRDFAVQSSNAQGDLSALNGLVDAALSSKADLLLTISTQALQSCLQRSQGLPIVFTMVANPFDAGAAKSNSDHLHTVTGAYGSNDVEGMMPIIRKLMPDAKRVGALFAPSEVNSVYNHDLLKAAAKKAGYELVSVGVDSAAEAAEAARNLCDQKIDLICLPNSNFASSTYPAISQAAEQSRLPVFGFLSGIASQGALVVLTRDYFDMGVESGRLAARVIRGESPKDIPLHQATKVRLIVNTNTAKSLGIELPESFLKSADRIIAQ